ncbi:MAG: 50S ribosomal protein L32 [bacterium]
MPVPRRRHCPARRDRGRTHKKMRPIHVQACPNCGGPKLPHRACPDCGQYNGRQVVVKVNQ